MDTATADPAHRRRAAVARQRPAILAASLAPAVLQAYQQGVACSVEHVARAPWAGFEQCRVAGDQVRQSRIVSEARLPVIRYTASARAGLGEDHHRSDQRPVPQFCVHPVAPPHQIEIMGDAVDQKVKPTQGGQGRMA